MSELHELVARAIEAAHQATAPHTWWEATKDFLAGSAPVWAAVATIIAFGSAIASLISIRTAQKTSLLVLRHQLEREHRHALAAWYRSIEGAKYFGDILTEQRSERGRIFLDSLQISSIGEKVGMRTLDVKYWPLIECYWAYEISREEASMLSSYGRKTRRALKGATQKYLDWVAAKGGGPGDLVKELPLHYNGPDDRDP